MWCWCKNIEFIKPFQNLKRTTSIFTAIRLKLFIISSIERHGQSDCFAHIIIYTNYSSQFVVHGMKCHCHVDHKSDNNEHSWEISVDCRCIHCQQHTMCRSQLTVFRVLTKYVFLFRFSDWMRMIQRMIALPINYNFNTWE